MTHEKIDEHGDADQKHHGADARDEPQRRDRQRRHALPRKREHLAQRVLAFAREALAALVIHDCARVAHERHEPAQEQIDFFILRECVERAAAHEPVVGVIIHHVRAERTQQAVIPLRGGALEGRVLLPAGAHAVDNIIAAGKGREHGVDGINVVLQIGVHGNDAVGAIPQRHQAAQQRVLVAAVARQADTGKGRIARMQVGNELPGGILRAVVDEADAAHGADRPGGAQGGEFLPQAARRLGQHGLLVITGDRKIERHGHGRASLPKITVQSIVPPPSTVSPS